jgi:hypothetical protein
MLLGGRLLYRTTGSVGEYWKSGVLIHTQLAGILPDNAGGTGSAASLAKGVRNATD